MVALALRGSAAAVVGGRIREVHGGRLDRQGWDDVHALRGLRAGDGATLHVVGYCQLGGL